ncbi:MAG: DUF3024 domain-containing protein [Firmicutes bacterium]|nr:DUF3024 domain-containing protein [Bacillota bacterium]
MAFSELEIKRIQKLADSFLEKRRPPVHLRKELDLGYRIDGNSIVIFEIRPLWNNPEKIIEVPVAKTTYVKKNDVWKIYWQRADLKWHGYKPDPEVKTLDEFFRIVDEDEFGCFWG